MEEDAGDQPPVLAIEDDAERLGSRPSGAIASAEGKSQGTPVATMATYTRTHAPMKIGVITTRWVAENSAERNCSRSCRKPRPWPSPAPRREGPAAARLARSGSIALCGQIPARAALPIVSRYRSHGRRQPAVALPERDDRALAEVDAGRSVRALDFTR